MRGIKISLQDFALKMQGGLCARGGGGGGGGGGYLRNTTVNALKHDDSPKANISLATVHIGLKSC